MDYENFYRNCSMKIGYARISTKDQNIELQIEALDKIGCDKIYQDIISGAKYGRPGLNLALEVLRAGDTLIVWKLDRLGRTVKQLVELIGEFEKRGIHLNSITEGIDTSTASGKFFFHMMASLAEMERSLIIERTRAGLETARRLGKLSGRKPKMNPSKIQAAKKLLESGIAPKEVAKTLEISVATLYRWIPASGKFFTS